MDSSSYEKIKMYLDQAWITLILRNMGYMTIGVVAGLQVETAGRVAAGAIARVVLKMRLTF